ncbi:MAG: TraB/GumN family protein [Shimia sp.]|uniref:TraB/GumN family protein n=1 Tax=Shimia sp. TaxID=1954381 RepID=UPI004058B78D
MKKKYALRSAIVGLLSVGLLTLSTTASEARCKGTDLRKGISAQDRAKFAQQAARIPFAEGIIWEARRGDQTIHVVGTHHSGDGRHRKVVADASKFLKNADLLMLEIRTKEIEPQWDAVFKKPGVLLRQSGPYMSQLLRKDLWEQLSLRMQLHGFSPDELNRIQPWFITGSVVHGDCDPFAWNRSKGVDARLERVARSKRVPTMSLETVEESLRSISAEPIRNQVKMLEWDMLSKAEIANATVTLRNGYFDDKLAEAMLINEAFSYRDLKVSRSEVSRLMRSRDKYILDERNKNWMPRILSRKEKRIMVAVGAAHLPGKYGVLNLLKNKGYTLTMVKR